MSNLFKKVRIVHSPKQSVYFVQEKSVYSLRWKIVRSFPYAGTAPQGHPFDFQGLAFEKAVRYAETLLARSVVWERTNYFWS
jgi:hypothetical protein